MARTKASVGAKVSAGKSNKARCSAAAGAAASHSAGSGGSGSGSGGGAGGGAGNAVCPRDTPAWQRAITSFFRRAPRGPAGRGGARDEADADAGSPQRPRKRCVLESDDEAAGTEPAPSRDRDAAEAEAGRLEPLSGKDSHTLDEYYPRGGGEKGKGRGKKTKGKENLNVDQRNNKREREDSLEESVSKKVRIEC